MALLIRFNKLLFFEENIKNPQQSSNPNPFLYCITLIEEICESAEYEKGQRQFYDNLVNQVEKYMNNLLDQVYFSS